MLTPHSVHTPPPQGEQVRPTFLSLYSGAGGLDLGVAQAGFRAVFANDIIEDAVATHKLLHTIKDPEWAEAARNLRDARVLAADVRDIANEFYEGQADLVVGGPPCQGFSVAGRMDPEDPRSRHVFDFLGLVSKIKPRAFIMENVAALAKNKRWKEVIRQLRDTASLDYKVDLFVLNSSEWGVPQKRERMFLIGTPVGSEPVLFDNPPTRGAPKSVRQALNSIPPIGAPGNDQICTAKITLAKNPVLRKSPYAGMLFNGQGRVMDLNKPAPTLPASMGGNRTPIVDQDALDEVANAWVESYHERLFTHRMDPLPQLPDTTRMRRISVDEAAAIQTFPKDTPFVGRQSSRFRQIGNAVPPLLGFAVASTVRNVAFPELSGIESRVL